MDPILVVLWVLGGVAMVAVTASLLRPTVTHPAGTQRLHDLGGLELLLAPGPPFRVRVDLRTVHGIAGEAARRADARLKAIGARPVEADGELCVTFDQVPERERLEDVAAAAPFYRIVDVRLEYLVDTSGLGL